jgi:hypothetical protein
VRGVKSFNPKRVGREIVFNPFFKEGDILDVGQSKQTIPPGGRLFKIPPLGGRLHPLCDELNGGLTAPGKKEAERLERAAIFRRRYFTGANAGTEADLGVKAKLATSRPACLRRQAKIPEREDGAH